ncbi:tetratricopeptide repeat protein 39A isoform X1 [Lethenteron reissneri]|uniref:tetratricopeptide repeat protein 39A isoform X1 n=1 Tax=Lethenteron reissneri TaxID=7753 RepID=UPI002AB76895|nr:tetratricopeptide repeat protein 39A isoform X1 [Lethenteron reissneri]XP_061436162.1 tetratricopeptide repeat protein 39A isoform X1 [Lethenteron reissneri]XP_061436163.1 tetratricopeptide repeat protein 39A isoform X1 [Lethenteron reissneri]
MAEKDVNGPPVSLSESTRLCSEALDLFFSNHFTEAADALKPSVSTSMYHALVFGTITNMQAMLTFDPVNMDSANRALKQALDVCARFRRKSSVVDSISSLVSRTDEQLTEEELHAEICFAECLLQKACLTFIQDENMINFIKGGIKVRQSYNIYKECQQMLALPWVMAGENVSEFEGGVHLGTGTFNLILSMVPTRILKLLEFIGFSGNKGVPELHGTNRLPLQEVALSQLREGAVGKTLRSCLCAMGLLCYHTFISFVLGTGEGDVTEAEEILRPYLQRYPNGAIFLFFAGRIEEIKGNIPEAMMKLQECVSSQSLWPQFHHMCYWELMWCLTFRMQWLEAFHYADLLAQQNNWSRATYVYMKAAFLTMVSPAEKRMVRESEEDLYRQVSTLRQKLAGKSLPTEKFAVRKARRYHGTRSTNRLVLPALEMMYMWNGFTIVGREPALTTSMLTLITDTEESLTGGGEYAVDDTCLLLLLKGVCLKHLGRLSEAEEAFTQIHAQEKRLRHDQYLAPNAMFELGFLLMEHGGDERRSEARRLLENARTNYKKYSLESRLHFRIHAALNAMKRRDEGDRT